LIKIVYIVSTLKCAGPTNQLYYIISNLPQDKFEWHLITLSPEPKDSRWADYESLGVKLYSLNLSRLRGFFYAKCDLRQLMGQIMPDLIHTQGIRADSLVSSLGTDTPWFLTARNYPGHDYPMKFGRLRGTLMTKRHLAAMLSCNHVIACSKTISGQLQHHNIDSVAIQNGVNSPKYNSAKAEVLSNLDKPIFISVGSLIPRKNMQVVVEAFGYYLNNKKGSLVILGDGPQVDKLRSLDSDQIYLLGNVANVSEHLFASDYFVSASLSEGLPNTVLEALAAELPVILSNIPSHVEIDAECESACVLFSLEKGAEELAEKMLQVDAAFTVKSRIDALRVANEVFSAEKMSKAYQLAYVSVLEGK